MKTNSENLSFLRYKPIRLITRSQPTIQVWNKLSHFGKNTYCHPAVGTQVWTMKASSSEVRIVKKMLKVGILPNPTPYIHPHHLLLGRMTTSGCSPRGALEPKAKGGAEINRSYGPCFWGLFSSLEKKPTQRKHWQSMKIIFAEVSLGFGFQGGNGLWESELYEARESQEVFHMPLCCSRLYLFPSSSAWRTYWIYLAAVTGMLWRGGMAGSYISKLNGSQCWS